MDVLTDTEMHQMMECAECGSHYENHLQFYKISLILHYVLWYLSIVFIHKDIYFIFGVILVENSDCTGSILVLM